MISRSGGWPRRMRTRNTRSVRRNCSKRSTSRTQSGRRVVVRLCGPRRDPRRRRCLGRLLLAFRRISLQSLRGSIRLPRRTSPSLLRTETVRAGAIGPSPCPVGRRRYHRPPPRPIRAGISLRVGAWRSLVAHLHGVQGVGGSNPLAPTILSLRESCSFTRGFGVRCPFRARGREQCDRHDGGEVEGAVCHEWRRRLYRQREDRAPLGHMTILWIQPDASGDQELLISTGSRGSPARYGWMISMLVVGPNRVSTPSGVTSAA